MCQSTIRMPEWDIPIPFSMRANVMNRGGVWLYLRPRLFRNLCLHSHRYHCLPYSSLQFRT